MNISDTSARRGEPGHVWRSGQERRLQMIDEWADLSGRLLDNGCGLGTYLKAFGRYSSRRFGLEAELERALASLPRAEGVVQALGEHLPFVDNAFDIVFSNEVIEHVSDDRLAISEMSRVTRPGGRIVIFCPNRWYPVEQHGVYWRGRYHFGNVPLVGYLPDALRSRLAPHVRTYTKSSLFRLMVGLPLRVVHYQRIFGGYDNIERRWPWLGKMLKKILYSAESTPASVFGLSHLLIMEKVRDQELMPEQHYP